MSQSELDRLEMLAEVDELATGAARWAESPRGSRHNGPRRC